MCKDEHIYNISQILRASCFTCQISAIEATVAVTVSFETEVAANF